MEWQTFGFNDDPLKTSRLSSHSVEIKHSNHILANPEKAFEK